MRAPVLAAGLGMASPLPPHAAPGGGREQHDHGLDAHGMRRRSGGPTPPIAHDELQPDAIQLCAELLLVQLLGENDTGGARKAEHVEAVLELLPRPLALPPEFRAALDVGGTASYGMGKTGRDAYMRFVIRLFGSVKQRDAKRQVKRIAWARTGLSAAGPAAWRAPAVRRMRGGVRGLQIERRTPHRILRRGPPPVRQACRSARTGRSRSRSRAAV